MHTTVSSNLIFVQYPAALEEVLKRFPEWTADEDGARLAFTSTVRGWETLPVLV
jgi:hypothetical protein